MKCVKLLLLMPVQIKPPTVFYRPRLFFDVNEISVDIVRQLKIVTITNILTKNPWYVMKSSSDLIHVTFNFPYWA